MYIGSVLKRHFPVLPSITKTNRTYYLIFQFTIPCYYLIFQFTNSNYYFEFTHIDHRAYIWFLINLRTYVRTWRSETDSNYHFEFWNCSAYIWFLYSELATVTVDNDFICEKIREGIKKPATWSRGQTDILSSAIIIVGLARLPVGDVYL
jgi:hypothetical protein